MAKTNTTLTEKETALLNIIAEGMDSPGSGWLHEIGDGSHSEAAVLGSLIKKGLVDSRADTDGGAGTCYFVELTDEGAKIVGLHKNQWGCWEREQEPEPDEEMEKLEDIVLEDYDETPDLSSATHWGSCMIMFLVAKRDMAHIDRNACKNKLVEAHKLVNKLDIHQAPVLERARAKRMVESLEKALERYEKELAALQAQVSELDWSQA